MATNATLPQGGVPVLASIRSALTTHTRLLPKGMVPLPRRTFRYPIRSLHCEPIRITSNGPSTIPGITNAHKDLIDQAARDLGVEATSWLQSTKYILLLLCRAVILILDRPGPDSEPESDGSIRLEKESQRQNVLIIRTRDEDGLSRPINIEDVRMHALPLAREDIPQAGNGSSAIRVSISTAVKFITDLKDREEAAFIFAKKALGRRCRSWS